MNYLGLKFKTLPHP